MGFLKDLWNFNTDVIKGGLSILPGVGPYLSNQETNATNVAMQNQANKENQALFWAQTEYNKPINQMKRLQEAGLNPNLAYGQIADSRASAPPMMGAARVEPYKTNFSLADYQQVVNLQEQNKAIKLQNQLAAEELKMRKYENQTYRDSGSTRQDPAWLKASGRSLDAVRENFINPVSSWIDRSSFWKAAKDFAEYTSRKQAEDVGWELKIQPRR